MAKSLAVVLPTRNRADTLEHALRTCTAQDYEDMEIIVSDNFSTDATRDIVESCGDPRVRYINPGRRLSMSSHWEFALSHVQAQWITYLGDDDGLLPGSARAMIALAVDRRESAFCWQQIYYGWPGLGTFSEGRLIIPLTAGYSTLRSADVLRDVATFRAHYTRLPSIYKGLVKRSVLTAGQSLTGRTFCSIIPDVYSGVLAAALLPTYGFVKRPFTINGASAHSIGTSQMSDQGAQAGPAAEFLAENDIPFHSDIPHADSLPILVAESLLQVSDHVSGAARIPQVVPSVLMREAIRAAVATSPASYAAVAAVVREIGSRHSMNELAEQLIRRHPNRPSRSTEIPVGHNLITRTLVVDTRATTIANVFDASVFAGSVLALSGVGLLSCGGALRATCRSGWRRLGRALRSGQL